MQFTAGFLRVSLGLVVATAALSACYDEPTIPVSAHTGIRGYIGLEDNGGSSDNGPGLNLETGQACTPGPVDHVSYTFRWAKDNTPAINTLTVSQALLVTAQPVDSNGCTVAVSISLATDANDAALVKIEGTATPTVFKVTGRAVGNPLLRATVNGSTYSGYNQTLFIKAPLLSLSPSSLSLTAGSASARVTVTARDQYNNVISDLDWYAAGYTVTWSTANTAVATVSSYGTNSADVSGKTGGTTTVTAKLMGGTVTGNVVVSTPIPPPTSCLDCTPWIPLG
jgi:hypothetical protein